jgi:hypothetical protein
VSRQHVVEQVASGRRDPKQNSGEDAVEKRRSLARVLSALLVAAAVLCFLPIIRSGFINYDDHLYVWKNAVVLKGLSWNGLIWAFQDYGTTSNWHPITWLSLMLDANLSGSEPWGYHLTNLLFHALNSLLLFQLLRSMTGAMWRSFAVAAIFALHPVHVESVAWVSERKDVLSTCFLFVTLLTYAAYVRRRSTARAVAKRYYVCSIGSLLLGLLSKPMLVTAPLLLLLLDYWPLDRFKREKLADLIREKVPFLILSLVFSVITLITQSAVGSTEILEQLSVGNRLENGVVSYSRYVGKFFYPVHLAVLYPYPLSGWPVGRVALSLLVLAAATVTVSLFRQKRYLLMGWLWFGIALLPVIGIVQVGEQAIADRYTYVPYVGLSIMLIWGLGEIAQKTQRLRWLVPGTMTAGIFVLSGLANRQVHFWSNSEALFRHTLALTGTNPTADFQLGIALLDEKRYAEANKHFVRTLKWRPGFYLAHLEYAVSLVRQGQYAEAEEQCRICTSIKPNDDQVLAIHGATLTRLKRFQEAADLLKPVCAHKPNWAGAAEELGHALAGANRRQEAIDAFSRAVRLEPDNADFRSTLNAARAVRPLSKSPAMTLEATRSH